MLDMQPIKSIEPSEVLTWRRGRPASNENSSIRKTTTKRRMLLTKTVTPVDGQQQHQQPIISQTSSVSANEPLAARVGEQREKIHQNCTISSSSPPPSSSVMYKRFVANKSATCSNCRPLIINHKTKRTFVSPGATSADNDDSSIVGVKTIDTSETMIIGNIILRKKMKMKMRMTPMPSTALKENMKIKRDNYIVWARTTSRRFCKIGEQSCSVSLLPIVIMILLALIDWTPIVDAGQQQAEPDFHNQNGPNAAAPLGRQQVNGGGVPLIWPAHNGQPIEQQQQPKPNANLWPILQDTLVADGNRNGASGASALSKRSSIQSLDHLSSAELPAEFRGGDADETTTPREQSRLAKLCEQTSSVLASVLPAPFGGHKRSILCQFFGQVSLGGSGGLLKTELANKLNNGNRQQQQLLQPPLSNGQYAIGGIGPLGFNLQQQQEDTNSFMGGSWPPLSHGEPESIAILHQHEQAPVALMATNKHPIQLVLEHQQQQAAAASMATAKSSMPGRRTPVIMQQHQQQQQQQQQVYQNQMSEFGQNLAPAQGADEMRHSQRQEGGQPRPAPIRFSAPLIVTSPSDQAPLLSLASGGSSTSLQPSLNSTTSSGWRILNTSFLAGSSGGSGLVEERQQQGDDSGRASSPMPPLISGASGGGDTASFQSKYSERATAQSAPIAVAPSTETSAKNSTANANAENTPRTQQPSAKQARSYQRPRTIVVGGGGGGGNGSGGGEQAAADQLQIGKRTSESPHSSTASATTAASRHTDRDQRELNKLQQQQQKDQSPSLVEARQMEADNSTISQDGVRTIEIMAQSATAPASVAQVVSLLANPDNKRNDSTQMRNSSANSLAPAARSHSADLHQSQKREELVIASINNLTRIAFGNQLRDTVKVINKLIDQQSDLFGSIANRQQQQQQQQRGREQHKQGTFDGRSGGTDGDAGSKLDSMLASESISQPQVALTNSDNYLEQTHKGPMPSSGKSSSLLVNKSRSKETSSGKPGGHKTHKSGNKQVAASAQQAIVKQIVSGAAEKANQRRPKKQPAAGSSDKPIATIGSGRLASTAAKVISAKSSPIASAATKPMREPKLSPITTGTSAVPTSKSTLANRSKFHVASVAAPAYELKRLTTVGRELLAADGGEQSPLSGGQTAKIGSRGASKQHQREPSAMAPLGLGFDLERTSASRVDFRPSSASAWIPSSGPIRLSNGDDKSAASRTRQPDQQRQTIDEAQFEPMQRASTLQETRTSSSVRGAASLPTSTTTALSSIVTQYPWLLPDKSAMSAELFASSVSQDKLNQVQSSSDSRTTGAALGPIMTTLAMPSSSLATLDESQPKSSTTRRMVTSSYYPGTTGLKLMPSSSLKLDEQSQLLNRVESKQDSLTTLKMALTRSRVVSTSTTTPAPQTPPQPAVPTTVTVAAPGTSASTVAPQFIAVKSTRLPFSSGTQSRWIPSTMLVTRPPVSSKTTSTTTTTTTTTTRPSLAASGASATTVVASTAAPASSTTTTTAATRSEQTLGTTTSPAASNGLASSSSSGVSLNDLNELRASDTISKYTSHLNGEANELIATTRRHFQAGPLPQIANTGDYFNADTIASWPDKYHTMLNGQAPPKTSPDNQQQQQQLQSQIGGGASKSTVSAFVETTRRNGEEYDLADAAASSSPARLAYSMAFDPSDPLTSSTIGASDAAARLATTATLARHRFDTTQPDSAPTTTTRLATLGYIMSNTPGITILPSNHKLTPSTKADSDTGTGSEHDHDTGDQQQDESEQRHDSPQSSMTRPMDATMTTASHLQQQQQTSTELPIATAEVYGGTTRSKQAPPYTLIDHQAMIMMTSAPTGFSPSEAKTELSDQAAGATASSKGESSDWLKHNMSSPGLSDTGAGQAAMNISTSGGALTQDKLRPPYQGSYASGQDDSNEFSLLPDPTLVLDSSQSRPKVSRKLYELLVPSGQSFAGLQNPLNSQRFNWSALKYLAQSLLANSALMGGSSKYHNQSMPATPEALNSTLDGNSLQQYANLDLNETEMYNNSSSSSSSNNNNIGNKNVSNLFGSTQQRLFDLIARNGLPTNYYDLFATTNNTGDFMQQGEDTTSPRNVTNNSFASNNSSSPSPYSSSKGIFERAGNLIQEMKQLEQKKAAALLAALRYQVPGPLVRPWDVSSDFHHQFGLHPPSSISRFFSDRLDGTSNKQLPSSQLINTIKSTLFKQKFVARDELLARLNANKAIIN